MFQESFLPLVQNAALLLGTAVLFDAVTPLRPRVHQVVSGLAIALLGTCLMLTPWVHAPGIIFDTRTILLAVSGLYFGFVPTIIGMAPMVALRIGQGGEAAWVGVSTMLMSASVGIIWRHFRRQHLADLSWAELYSMGILIHVLMLLIMLALPWETAVAVLREIALPVLLVFPVGTLALGAVITNHMRRRRATEQMRASEAEIRATLYSIGDGVVTTDAQGRITRLNPMAERLTGWTEAQAKSKDLHEVFRIINEQTLATVENPVDRVLREGVVVGLANHTLLIAKDGTERPIADSASPIFNEDGKVAGVVLVFSNQEEARAAHQAIEESERRFRAIFEDAAIGVAEIDAKTGKHLRVNARYCRTMRYTDEQLLGMPFERILHPDDHGPMRDQGMRMIDGDIAEFSADVRIIRSDGAVRRVSGVVASSWAEGEEPTRMVLTLQDVTDQKLAEQQLQESRRQLATLMDNLRGMAYRCGNERSWQMDFVSKGAVHLTGYRPEELINNEVLSYGELILPEDRDRVWHAVQEGLQKRSQFQVTYRLRTASGEIRWVDERGTGVISESGEVVALEGFILDITEQTQAQMAVREAEHFTRSIIDALGSHLCVLDEAGNILATNAAWRGFAESNPPRPASASVGANYLKVCDSVEGPDRVDAAAFAAGIRAVLRGELPEYIQEYACHSPNEQRWFIGRVTRFSGSGPRHIVISHNNITSRKTMEQSLAESEARFRSVVETIPEAIYIQMDGRFVYANPAAVELFGVKQARELLGQLILDRIHPAYRDREHARMRQVCEELSRVPMSEGKLLRPDGSTVDVEVSALPFRFEQKSGSLVFARDITDRKRAERELAMAADFSLSLLKQAPVLIWRAGLDGRCDWFNDTWMSFTGRTIEQEFGDGWIEGVHEEDVSRCLKIYIEAFDVRQQFSMEYRLRRADGVYRWVLDCGIPFNDLDGAFSGYIGYCFDITDMKEAERSLREMAMELSLTEERERRRLAEHLHDEVCQILSLAQIKLSMARQQDDQHLQLNASAEELVVRANRSLRALLMEMSHPALYDLGFSEGAEWLVEDMHRLYGLKVTLEDDKSFSGMEIRTRVVLFQCLRELLANVAKHSGVTEAVARLYTKDGMAHIEVKDSGRGFVVDRLEKHTSEGGFGLFAIRERLRSAGGKMEIRSKPLEGSVVILSLLRHNSKDE